MRKEKKADHEKEAWTKIEKGSSKHTRISGPTHPSILLPTFISNPKIHTQDSEAPLRMKHIQYYFTPFLTRYTSTTI